MHRRTNTGEDVFIQETELKYLYVRNLHGMPSYFSSRGSIFIEPNLSKTPAKIIEQSF